MKSPNTDWFTEARFGMFIHWGLYAVPAGEWHGQRMEYIGEWLQSRFRIPAAEYEAIAPTFNPVDFNADEWVRTAKRAGMRYIVFTTKHHDGFAMYASKCDPFNIVDATPFKRDPQRELADACARQDVRLGIYYSQDLDWHEPDGGDPGPTYHTNSGMSWGNDWDFPDLASKHYDRYFTKKVIPQLRELLGGYGPISVIWFDCPVTISPAHSAQLRDLVREMQPDCLINSRLGNGLGDYSSMGDNQLPTVKQVGIWETPATLNDTWGYKHFDHNWKSAKATISILAGNASRGVNYLLNIGPTGEGRFPAPAIAILNQIGDWMDRCGEAIHGAVPSPFDCEFDWGWVTQRATGPASTRLYLILNGSNIHQLSMSGIRNRATHAQLLNTAEAIPFQQDRDADGHERLHLSVPSLEALGSVPVIALDLDGAFQTLD